MTKKNGKYKTLLFSDSLGFALYHVTSPANKRMRTYGACHTIGMLASCIPAKGINIASYLYLRGVSTNACDVTVHAEPDSEEILDLLRFGVQFFSIGIFGCPIESVTNLWYCKKYVLAKPMTSLLKSFSAVIAIRHI